MIKCLALIVLIKINAVSTAFQREIHVVYLNNPRKISSSYAFLLRTYFRDGDDTLIVLLPIKDIIISNH